MADTLIEIEKKIKKIYKARQIVEKNNKKISELRQDVMRYMSENDKRILRVGDYAIEIKHRDKRFADYDLIKLYIDKGILPEETLKTSKILSLNITTKADFELSGNKFIRKGKDDNNS